MIRVVCLLLLIVSLLILTVQDYKHRAISWWLIPLILITYLGLEGDFYFFKNHNTWANLTFVGVIFIVSTIYFSMRERRFIILFKNHLGIGDVLFFMVCAFMFDLPNYIFYLTGSFVFSIILFGIHYLKKRDVTSQIPLAGIMSFLLIPLFILKVFFSIDCFRNFNFISLPLL